MNAEIKELYAEIAKLREIIYDKATRAEKSGMCGSPTEVIGVAIRLLKGEKR